MPNYSTTSQALRRFEKWTRTLVKKIWPRRKVSDLNPSRPMIKGEIKNDADAAIQRFLTNYNATSSSLPMPPVHRSQEPWLNIIYPTDGWILEKMARVLTEGIPGSQGLEYHELHALGERSPILNPEAINYYLNYALFEKKSPGVDAAWFTHIEEGNKALREQFFKAVQTVDFAIFNSPKYQALSGITQSKSKVILPGVDEELFSRKLVLGVIGRNYDYTDRKNGPLVERIRQLPFVELRFTGGVMPTEELPRFYRELDYVFTASTIEGGPMSLLEGLAAGKLSIFPRDVGLWSEFQDSVITYDLENLDDLEVTLERLHADKQKAVGAVSNCTWDIFAQQHRALFEDLRRIRGCST